jgi:hypothetical protein
LLSADWPRLLAGKLLASIVDGNEMGSVDLFCLEQSVNKLDGHIGGDGPEEKIDRARTDITP